MRVRGSGGQGPLHEGTAAAWGAERELELKCDFLWYLRQHRRQKETPLDTCFRVYRATHQGRRAVPPLAIKASASRRAWYFHLCALALVMFAVPTL